MYSIDKSKRTTKLLVIVIMVMLCILFIPTAAFALDGVTQKLNLEGGFVWSLSATSSVVPGYSDTINVGGTTKIQYDIDPSDLRVGSIRDINKGTITVTIPDVTGSVYIQSMDIFIERLNGSVWEKLADSDGNVCRVPVVKSSSPVPVTGTTTVLRVPDNSYMDIPPITYSDDIRWVSEMRLERDGILDETIYTGSQFITSLYGP